MKKLTKNAKKQLLNVAFVLVLIGITVTVLLVNNRELNAESIRAFFAECNPYLIAAAFCCMLLFILFEAVSLFVISRRLGHRCKFRRCFAYSSADTYYSAITPSATGGQPAAAFYMARDGIGAGRATFTLVFNLIAYTAAILVIGIAAVAMNPALYMNIESTFVHVLIVVGAAVQVVLLVFFILCMFCGGAVLKLGKKLIAFLHKIRFVKNAEKWTERLAAEVEKYRSCLKEIKKSPALFLEALFFNVLQRVSQTLIPCFVCYSVMPSVPFADLFVMQAYVLLGYNCVPLPGGVGAYEYLYINIYCLYFDRAFILVAMMISRFISYYVCVLFSGAVTLTYHLAGGRKEKPDLQRRNFEETNVSSEQYEGENNEEHE